jgi:hypothetical protein
MMYLGALTLLVFSYYGNHTTSAVIPFILAATAGFVATHSPCGINALYTITAAPAFPGENGIWVIVRRLRERIAVKQTAFGIGCIVGGAIAGAVSAALGRMLLNYPIAVVVALAGGFVALTYGASELFGLRLPLPSSPWRVPRQWMFHGSPFYELRFGLCLGLGFPTLVPFVGVYLLLTYCFLFMSVGQAIAVMVTFALCRVFPMVYTQSMVYRRSRTIGQMVASIKRLMDSNLIAVVRAYALLMVAGTIGARLVDLIINRGDVVVAFWELQR